MVRLAVTFTLLLLSMPPVTANETDLTAAMNKAVDLINQGHEEEGIAMLEATILSAEKTPGEEDLIGIAGERFLEMGEFDRAIATYQKAIRHFPNNALYHSSLATAYVQNNQPDNAIQETELAVQLSPNDPFVLYYAAELYMQVDRMPKAKDFLRKTMVAAQAAGERTLAEQAGQVLMILEGQTDQQAKQMMAEAKKVALSQEPQDQTTQLPNSPTLSASIARHPQATDSTEPVVTFSRDQQGTSVLYVVPISVAMAAVTDLEAAREHKQALDICRAVSKIQPSNAEALACIDRNRHAAD